MMSKAVKKYYERNVELKIMFLDFNQPYVKVAGYASFPGKDNPRFCHLM